MDIIEHVLKNGGITLDMDRKPVSHNDGFYVSIAALDRIAIHNLTELRIDKNLLLLKKIYGHVEGVYLGLWIDKGECYIDASIHVKQGWYAMMLGKTFQQVAIWDCENRKGVRV